MGLDQMPPFKQDPLYLPQTQLIDALIEFEHHLGLSQGVIGELNRLTIRAVIVHLGR